MNEEFQELLANLPAYLGGHMLLSTTALAVGVAVSVPLGIVASRRPKLTEYVLGVAGVIQTVPSLALLGLTVLLLGGWIGFVPGFLVLVLYSVLPMLANTVVGIRGVDPTLVEAARGLGMSEKEMLWRVQLPLAAPVIISGVRTATVLVVGTATLVTPVGGLSLGNYIFAGLANLDPMATVFGCVAAALLAILLDQLVRLLEVAARRRSRRLARVALAGLLLVTAGGLYYPVTTWLVAVAKSRTYEKFQELLANLPAYLGGHMLLSTTSLAVGVAVSLPLGILASRRPKLTEYVLGIAGVFQTVPSLALLGLTVLLLGGVIGFVPGFLVLVVYSVLPILANTVVGIRGVDPTLVEAARGLGMSEKQMLWRVQLPLAAPVIISGIRTATVLVVGTATLVTPVGGLSLGNYIFAGLATLNHMATVFGCVAAALLAVLLDQLVRLLEVAARRRKRRLAFAALAGLLLFTAGGLYYPVTTWLAGGYRPVIASTVFTEQYILSHVMAHRLEAAGFRPERLDGMSYGIQLEGLRRNQVDCAVTYTGDIWALLMKRRDYKDRETTAREVKRFLEEDFGVVWVGLLGFQNNYALAMPTARAKEWGNLETIENLASYTKSLKGKLKVGADLGFFERPEWRRLKERYRFEDSKIDIQSMDQTRLYDAVKYGIVDVIVAYTSDGRVPAYTLKLLKDEDHQVFPPYDAILLVSRAAAAQPGFVEALKPLVGAIDLETMQEANRHVDMDHQSPAAAAQWLMEAIPNKKKGGLAHP